MLYNDDGIVGRQMIIAAITFRQDSENKNKYGHSKFGHYYSIVVWLKRIKSENICLFISACISWRKNVRIYHITCNMHLYTVIKVNGSRSMNHSYSPQLKIGVLIDAVKKIFYLAHVAKRKRNYDLYIRPNKKTLNFWREQTNYNTMCGIISLVRFEWMTSMSSSSRFI